MNNVLYTSRTAPQGARLRFAILLSGILLAGATLSASAPPSLPAASADRSARWQQDFRALTEGFSASGVTLDMLRGISTRGQKDFAKLYPLAVWEPALQSLTADVPNLSDSEVELQLMRLIASAWVAHNVVRAPQDPDFTARLPLTFSWYADGPALTAATPDYTAALGTHLLRIGSMDPQQLLAAAAPFLSYENDAWLRQRAPQLLSTAAMLKHLHLLGADGRVEITLAAPNAQPFTIRVAPVPESTKQVPVAEALHIPTALFRSHPGTPYWDQYLPESQTLFFQYNACKNDPAQPFKDFTRQLLALAAAHPVHRLVIDLRQNGGGNSTVIDPLLKGLAARPALAASTVVLIGTGTFSSAVQNADTLHRVLHATLIGERTGGMPSGYGEVKTLILPNSKVQVQFTSKYFSPEKGASVAVVEPDIVVHRTLEDALAGRDPALDAAIAPLLQQKNSQQISAHRILIPTQAPPEESP